MIAKSPLVSFAAVALVGLLVCPASAAAPPGNPCTNGSFEKLAPNGFPVDWSPVGRTVRVSNDAHSGRYSLELLRLPDTPTRETGLNRGWRPGSRGGAMLTELRGGIDFWYKAIAADDAQLNIYVIPMNDEPREGTGSPRAVYTVPAEHIGDGQWHHARLKYDYTNNPKVKWVHFAARIVGTTGHLLLDDISYVEQVGPLLSLSGVWFEEHQQAPGRCATVRVLLNNVGDRPTDQVEVRLVLPDGLEATPAVHRISRLAPEERKVLRWTVEGARITTGLIKIAATSGQLSAQAEIPLQRSLRIRSFGPVEPVVFAGKPAAVECEVENTGQVILRNVTAEFSLLDRPVRKSLAVLAPGQKAVLVAEAVFPEPTDAATVSVLAQAATVPPTGRLESSLLVIPTAEVPEPSGTLQAEAGEQVAVLENQHVRLVFFHDGNGFGPARLELRGASGWQPAAWLPLLGRVVAAVAADRQGAKGQVQCALRCSEKPHTKVEPPVAVLTFPCTADLQAAGRLDVRVQFRLESGSKLIHTSVQATCRRRCKLLALDGPMLYVRDRQQAVLPGLEWLLDDELSSDVLDIAESHPDRIRYVPHPNKITIPAVGITGRYGTVGMIWDVHQKWDGRRDRPALVFASPDRFGNHRSHLLGLFLPGVPEFLSENQRLAEKPYLLEPGQLLKLSAWIYGNGSSSDVLAPVEEYLRLVGLPEAPPLPHGNFEGEIEFSMQAYLKSLWDAESQQWWTTKGNALLSHQGRPPAFVADLLVGEMLSQDPQVRRACRQRAEQVAALLGRPARLDVFRFPGRADLATANPARAAQLLTSRDFDPKSGAWRYDADREGHKPFEGKDYRELGPDGAVEVGTCARNAYVVLSYARIAGDLDVYEAVLPTLELMERFRVPRAAQVWEVPVHTPDVLAAADAVDAYIEAYRITGDRRWLADAVTWARRGLPFIYLWHDPEKPFLLGASIPVFGATWYRGSWFGRPVQWNGLRYANALLKLAEYDRSLPWRQVAELIIRSAIQQQDLEGENVALWPDNISAIDSKKCPWVFAPRQIIGCILKLIGRDEEPRTVIVGAGRQRLHLTSTARISEARWENDSLRFTVQFPPKERGVVLVSNIARPKVVRVGGRAATERKDVEIANQAGWRYDASLAYLLIGVPQSGPVAVEVQPAGYAPTERVPAPADQIAFEFTRSVEGWLAAHHVEQLAAQNGCLEGTITGVDPYLVRLLLRVPADSCPVLYLRMRVTAGAGGQLFWTTEEAPGFDEAKSLRFNLVGDGRWHEYRLAPGDHPLWKGKMITALRIDPGGGAATGRFSIDYIRGATH